MPLYTYENNESGERIVLFQPIAQRDQVMGFTRVFEPPTAPMPGTAENPFSMDVQMRKGLQKMEERDRRALERDSQFSTKELAAAWN